MYGIVYISPEPANWLQRLAGPAYRTYSETEATLLRPCGHGGSPEYAPEPYVQELRVVLEENSQGVFLQASLPAPGPGKGGLASLYPGDEGIECDPRVLYVDDFETGTVDEIGARWGSISRKENIALSEDIHGDSPGNKSIHISDNGHLYTHTRGADTMYARFYVKFHEKTGYVHHFVHLVADRTPTPWPKGGAGETPPGDAKFSTGIEPSGRSVAGQVKERRRRHPRRVRCLHRVCSRPNQVAPCMYRDSKTARTTSRAVRWPTKE